MNAMLVSCMVLSVLIFGCSSSNSKPLLISFSNDSSQVRLSNIDEAGIWQLKDLQKSGDSLAGLVVVLQMPSAKDTAARELLISGKLRFVDRVLVFQPDQPFLRGRDYLVVTHLNTSFGDFRNVLQGNLNTRVKPLQKILRR